MSAPSFFLIWDPIWKYLIGRVLTIWNPTSKMAQEHGSQVFSWSIIRDIKVQVPADDSDIRVTPQENKPPNSMVPRKNSGIHLFCHWDNSKTTTTFQQHTNHLFRHSVIPEDRKLTFTDQLQRKHSKPKLTQCYWHPHYHPYDLLLTKLYVKC